jgi:hypothetical protein
MTRRLLLVVGLILSLSLRSKAGPLLGSSVSGVLFFGDPPMGPNYFGNIPACAPTTVTISPTGGFCEFGYGYLSVLFADSQPQLTIDFNTLPSGSEPVTIQLTDTAFQGLGIVGLTDTFPSGGLMTTLNGDEITVTWPGVDLPLGPGSPMSEFSSTFDVEAVPEPSALVLVLFGFCLCFLMPSQGGGRLD